MAHCVRNVRVLFEIHGYFGAKNGPYIDIVSTTNGCVTLGALKKLFFDQHWQHFSTFECRFFFKQFDPELETPVKMEMGNDDEDKFVPLYHGQVFCTVKCNNTGPPRRSEEEENSVFYPPPSIGTSSLQWHNLETRPVSMRSLHHKNRFHGWTEDAAALSDITYVSRNVPRPLRCPAGYNDNYSTYNGGLVHLSMHPIDPAAWVDHVEAVNALHMCEETTENQGQYLDSNVVTRESNLSQLPEFNLTVGSELTTVVAVLRVSSFKKYVKLHTWMKMDIPDSFLGKELVNWLLIHIDGLKKRKEAVRYSTALLQEECIKDALPPLPVGISDKKSFSENRYYQFGTNGVGGPVKRNIQNRALPQVPSSSTTSSRAPLMQQHESRRDPIGGSTSRHFND